MSVRFLSPSRAPFHKFLQLGANNGSPASLEVLSRICRSLRERLDSGVRQLQMRLVAFREQLNRHQRIARVPFIPPGVSDLLLRNHLGDFTKMVISHAFVLDDEFKFKTDRGSEFLQVE